MTELLSLVVTVRVPQPVTVPGHLGRAVHALLLRWLDADDPELARRWHNTDGHKPFTCSTLIGGKRINTNARRLTPEREYWFRITSLDPQVSATLLNRAGHPAKSVDLDGVLLAVTGMTVNAAEHAWAGAQTYEELAAPYLLAREQAPKRLRLEFVSPVAFHQNGMNTALPLPDLIFGGLCDRWNAFSPIGVSPQVREYARHAVALSGFSLRSRSVPIKDGALHIGCVGKTTYAAVHYDRYWMSVLGLLADFAFYSGAGRLTTAGMGQSRRIEAG